MDNTIKMGSVCIESESKDIVKITNGTEIDGVFMPTEAIAVRFIGITQTNKGAYPRLAYTYRKVNLGSLSLATISAPLFDDYNKLAPKYRIGRV